MIFRLTIRPSSGFPAKRILVFVVFVMFSVLSLSQTFVATALSPEQRRLIDSGILYYDPEETVCASAEGSPQLEGSDNISQIFNYLVSSGLPDFQAAGIMGNMQHESGYEPLRLEGTPPGTETSPEDAKDSSNGWGLVQWTPAGKFINPTLDAGKDPGDIGVQLDFLLEQLEGGTPSPEAQAGEVFFASTNVLEATIAFEASYERHHGISPSHAYTPSHPSHNLQPDRVVEAERILEMSRQGAIDSVLSSTGGGDGGPSSTGACARGGQGGGDVVNTALTYSWPEYESGKTDKKPEYDAAITEAQQDGQYIGGCGGVDCGGFVTRVMVDSGFEPQYNYGGDTGSGAGPTPSQLEWVRQNWTEIGTISSTAELEPGDVAFRVHSSGADAGHTFMWVGDQNDFEHPVASSALCSRAPMAGVESPISGSSDRQIVWFRR